jgi:ankyrin repeat protein
MYAVVADFGDTTMVDLLLRSGARTDARDPKGRTAADYAREYGHDHLIGRLSPRSQP